MIGPRETGREVVKLDLNSEQPTNDSDLGQCCSHRINLQLHDMGIVPNEVT